MFANLNLSDLWSGTLNAKVLLLIYADTAY